MNTELTTKIGATVAKVGFQLRKHSPIILVASGIAGVVTSAVLACKATLQANDVMANAKVDLAAIRKTTTVEDAKKEVTGVYVKTGLELARLYLPSVGLGVLSLAGIVGSNQILSKRNTALAAAYATIDGGFREYRARVISRFGEDTDKELRLNTHAEKIEETVIGEDGKTKKVKKTVQVTDLAACSDYARFYDQNTSEAYEDDHDYNLMFLKAQQSHANMMLARDGYLFLNDVYALIGIDRSVAGQVVGWVLDKKAEDQPVGDNYIDFHITETYVRDDHGELVPAIFLDFNVDGNIWERAAKKNLLTA